MVNKKLLKTLTDVIRCILRCSLLKKMRKAVCNHCNDSLVKKHNTSHLRLHETKKACELKLLSALLNVANVYFT